MQASTGELTLKKFLDDYGESLAEQVTTNLEVIHDPRRDQDQEMDRRLSLLKKKPFPAQAEIIKAAYKAFQDGLQAVFMACEMGTGKSLMGIGVAMLLGRQTRSLVLCPPHLVGKWHEEIRQAWPEAMVINLNGRHCLPVLEGLRQAPRPTRPEFYIIGKERAKSTFQWRPAAVIRRGQPHCPRCGGPLLDKDGVPLPIFERNNQGQYRRKFACHNYVRRWVWDSESGKHVWEAGPCGEQLWQPDRFKKQYLKPMPAEYIKKYLAGCWNLLIADECHAYKNQSGQGWAFAALAGACHYTLCLTGTLAGGYASDIFYLLFRTNPNAMVADGNTFNNPTSFMEKYGVLERVTTVSEEDGLTTKARKRTLVRAKPGISPLLLGKMLLPNAVFLRLNDVTANLAPYEEEVIELAMQEEQAQCYKRFEDEMRSALLSALACGDHSLLGSYLNALLSYPERIYQGVAVHHPHSKELVAYGPPVEGVMPKEQELLEIVGREVARGRKVLVYIQNSLATDISPRLVELLTAKGQRVKVLRSGEAEGRSQKINHWLKQGLDVLICNPRLVETGLDLLDFPSIVFYQTGYSTYTLRQAARRSWRIPQKKPVKVYFLVYGQTMQTRAMKLIANKLTCSLALEGEITEQGLAAIADAGDSLAKELARMLVNQAEDNQSLKDVWAGYRKKEVLSETPLAEVVPLVAEDTAIVPANDDVLAVSMEAEQIGGKVVKVTFYETGGRRRKKVTQVEVRQADLNQVIASTGKTVMAQFEMF